MNQDVYCSDQFSGLHIRSAKAGTAIIGPCCNTDGHAVEPAKFDYVNDQYLQDIRRAAQQGQRAGACANCWKHEDSGGISRRLNGRSDPGSFQGITLKRLDYTTQNICNLACVHCSSISSSLWAKLDGDSAAVEDDSYHDKVDMLGKIDLGSITQVHFTGGEPLMTREHVKVLDLLDRSGRLAEITGSYNTNCTFYPSEEVLTYWSKMKRVNIICSIDGVGAVAELLRWPCQWSQVDRTFRALHRLRSAINVSISLNVSVGNYNFLELGDIVDWVQDIDPTIFINWQLVNQEHLHPSVMPEHAYTQALEVLARHQGLQQWHRGFERVENKDHKWNSTLDWLDRLDQQRGTQWRSVLRLAAMMDTHG